MAFIELFECAQEQMLLPLFNMMEGKLFKGGNNASQLTEENKAGEPVRFLLG
jgi:hypothetical protein